MQMITIAGNIGKDAETRSTNSGSVTGFNVGVSAGRDAETVWYRCSLWGTRGDKLAQYLTKGSKVTVAGTLTPGLYEGKLDLKVNVSEVALQGGKRDDGGRRSVEAGGGFSGSIPPTDDMDDDVPFILALGREPGTSRRVL